MQNNKNLIILLSLFSNIYWFSRYSRFQVLWICDILVRIRIRWSLPLTYGFGTFCYRQWLTRSQNKYVFFQFYYFVVHIYNEESSCGRHDTQHNDTQHNRTQHKGLISETQHSDVQHNDTLILCWMSLCWVSWFIYCYAECHNVEFHYA
jgi:hypothetical protein